MKFGRAKYSMETEKKKTDRKNKTYENTGNSTPTGEKLDCLINLFLTMTDHA